MNQCANNHKQNSNKPTKDDPEEEGSLLKSIGRVTVIKNPDKPPHIFRGKLTVSYRIFS